MQQTPFYSIKHISQKHFGSMMQRWLMLSLLVTLVSQTAFSQQPKKKKDRFPSYFGLTAAPIFGSNFIRSDATLADAFTFGDAGFANRFFTATEKEKRPFSVVFRINGRSNFWE